MKRLTRAGAAALCLAVLAGSTAVAKVTRVSFEYYFPGVDEDGNLDFDLGADGVVKATYRDRKNRLRVVGRAVVDNESKKLQIFQDVGVFDDLGIDGQVIRDRYRVNKKGRAKYNGLIKNVSEFST